MRESINERRDRERERRERERKKREKRERTVQNIEIATLLLKVELKQTF